MNTHIARIRSLEGLRRYVNETLCDSNQLEFNAFRMTERVLRRLGKPCGLYFCLHGPRAVKFTAIWETDHNQILFYGATGERFQRIQLEEGPQLHESAPRRAAA